MELRVPFGVDDSGRTIELDLKMAALGGMGPHGMLVGSGKSDLVRTLLYGLAATHAPDELNLLLVDFGDGATFAGLDELSHTSAVVSDLSAEPALVRRLYDALAGELARRQALLHGAGRYSSRHNYEEARAEGAPLDPMPSLLVVVDRFSELLGSHPGFTSVLAQIGRVGRGLGVHLLLATQVLEEGRLRGLDGYLSYRIALRTSSAAESRAVIGISDAYELPDEPGAGYFKTGTDRVERFRAASVDASQAEVLNGAPAYRIWQPPLDEPPALEALLPATVPGRLRVPVGIVDKPFEHRLGLLWLDLSGDGGNVAIVGGPGSGKSTLVRSLIESLTLTHTPEQVGFYPLSATSELTALLERRGRGEADRFPSDVFLVIDGEHAEIGPDVIRLAARGLGHGVHVVATAERWDEFPAAFEEQLRTKLELRGDRPGRGLTADKLHFLGAVPADLRQ